MKNTRHLKNARAEKSRPKQIKHQFLYKGLITCPKANRLLVGEVQKGVNKSGQYIYYRCHHKCEFCNNCKRIIKADVIDMAIIESIKTINITEEQLKKIREDLKGIMYANKEFNEKRKIQIDNQLTKLNNRLSALYDDKLDGLISAEIYIKKRDSWQAQIDELMIELTALNKTNNEIFNRIEKMLELCKDLVNTYLCHTDDKKEFC